MAKVSTRVLIVVFDALRPEFVTPELMPNLHAFAAGGVSYTNSHSVFPTETRVNQTAVVTGCLPRRTGIVANVFPARDVFSDRVVNTGKDEELEAAFAEAGARLIQVPTLGQRLTAAGLRYASLSAGTPGGGRLINHSALADETFRLAMRRPEAACPQGVFEKITAKVGELPHYERPATAWISWAVDAYLGWVEPQVRPDVMLLWLCEPDETFHYHGIGSPESLVTIRHDDAEFGRILDAHAGEIASGQMQVIAMSDHGQITLRGEPVDIPACMREAGLRAGRSPGADVDYTVVVHNGGGIWVRDDDPALTAQAVDFLVAQDWCGAIFTRDGARGTLKLSDIAMEHLRGPTIAMALRTDDDSNAAGRDGMTRHDAPYPTGGGCHGGLSRYELNNFISMAGGAFRSGAVIDAPAGNIDITPTVGALLGLDIAHECDGRVLREALRDGVDIQPGDWTQTTIAATNDSGARTHLTFSELDGARYLDQAWVEG